jgi:hypothetical protein
MCCRMAEADASRTPTHWIRMHASPCGVPNPGILELLALALARDGWLTPSAASSMHPITTSAATTESHERILGSHLDPEVEIQKSLSFFFRNSVQSRIYTAHRSFGVRGMSGIRSRSLRCMIISPCRTSLRL